MPRRKEKGRALPASDRVRFDHPEPLVERTRRERERMHFHHLRRQRRRAA